MAPSSGLQRLEETGNGPFRLPAAGSIQYWLKIDAVLRSKRSWQEDVLVTLYDSTYFKHLQGSMHERNTHWILALTKSR
jgi:hypothetical protein